MDRILRKLFEGELFPYQNFHPLSKEYKKLAYDYELHRDKFIELLNNYNPVLSKEYQDVADEHATLLFHEISEMFIDGFRLGATMMIEILDVPDSDDLR